MCTSHIIPKSFDKIASNLSCNIDDQCNLWIVCVFTPLVIGPLATNGTTFTDRHSKWFHVCEAWCFSLFEWKDVFFAFPYLFCWPKNQCDDQHWKNSDTRHHCSDRNTQGPGTWLNFVIGHYCMQLRCKFCHDNCFMLSCMVCLQCIVIIFLLLLTTI